MARLFSDTPNLTGNMYRSKLALILDSESSARIFKDTKYLRMNEDEKQPAFSASNPDYFECQAHGQNSYKAR